MKHIIIILNNEKIKLEKVFYTTNDNFIELYNSNGKVCISIQEISYYSVSSKVLTFVLKDNFSGFLLLRGELSGLMD